jgi:hypothetical protein
VVRSCQVTFNLFRLYNVIFQLWDMLLLRRVCKGRSYTCMRGTELNGILMVSGAHVELRYVFWLSSASVSRNEHITIGTACDNWITGLVSAEKVATIARWITSLHDSTILCHVISWFLFILWFIYTVLCLFGARAFIQIIVCFVIIVRTYLCSALFGANFHSNNR